MASNSDRFIFAFYTAHRVGAVFVPINPAAAPPEIDHLLEEPGTALGAKHVVLSRFDPAEVIDVMEAERITMSFGVRTMYQFLLNDPGIGSRDLSAWRTGLFGAAPTPARDPARRGVHGALRLDRRGPGGI